jgi:hypothetical protein
MSDNNSFLKSNGNLSLLCLQAKENFTYKWVVTHTRKGKEEFYERVFGGNQKIKEIKKKVIPTHALSTPIQHKKKTLDPLYLNQVVSQY